LTEAIIFAFFALVIFGGIFIYIRVLRGLRSGEKFGADLELEENLAGGVSGGWYVGRNRNDGKHRRPRGVPAEFPPLSEFGEMEPERNDFPYAPDTDFVPRLDRGLRAAKAPWPTLPDASQPFDPSGEAGYSVVRRVTDAELLAQGAEDTGIIDLVVQTDPQTGEPWIVPAAEASAADDAAIDNLAETMRGVLDAHAVAARAAIFGSGSDSDSGPDQNDDPPPDDDDDSWIYETPAEVVVVEPATLVAEKQGTYFTQTDVLNLYELLAHGEAAVAGTSEFRAATDPAHIVPAESGKGVVFRTGVAALSEGVSRISLDPHAQCDDGRPVDPVADFDLLAIECSPLLPELESGLEGRSGTVGGALLALSG
jgi:hypothetical protein